MIEKLSKLMRIKLSDEEKRVLGDDIPRLLEYVGKLKSVDSSGLKIDIPKENIFREDVAIISKNRDAIISSFSDRKGKFLKVKSVWTSR